jgi:hypothetical protein
MSSCSSSLCAIQPVLDLLPECVNPGSQSPQPPRVDFLLEPSDLIAQIAEILGEVFRARLDQGIRLSIGLQGMVRPVGQFADFPAELARVRPGTILACIAMQFLGLRVCHRWFFPVSAA